MILIDVKRRLVVQTERGGQVFAYIWMYEVGCTDQCN
jgi:hypothetical protein